MQRWLPVLAVIVRCFVAHVGCVNPAPENCLNYESTYHVVRACDCVVYQSYGLNDGQFISPNFPEFYPPNTNCILYSFLGDAFEIIELTFLEFDLRMPDSNGNCTDFVRVFQNLERPEVNENIPYDVELCGNYSSLRPKKFYSSHRSLILEFHTESPTGQNRQYKGFRGIYRFLDKRNFVTTGLPVEGQLCTYEFRSNATHRRGRFFSPFYPQTYRPNARCRYNFHGQRGEVIKLIFTNIQLHHRGGSQDLVSCFNAPDLITVYNGIDADSTIIKQFCSFHNGEEVLSRGNNLLVTFETDRSMEEQGFAATYEFVGEHADMTPVDGHSNNTHNPPVLPNSFGCGGSISSMENKTGTISSPSYPKPYPAALTCRFTFQGVGRERVQLKFVHLDLYYPSGDPKAPVDCTGSDTVSVYIQINGRNEALGTYCGAKLPPMLMSNSNTMTVEFRSRRPLQTVTGFLANYEFVTNFGITTGQQDKRGTCIFSYMSSSEPEGHIMSPNYPGLYPRNTECHYLFYGKGKERVHITFLTFDVDGIGPRCEENTKSDYVSFSNFFETEDRKLYRMCGLASQSKHKIESDGLFFRVTFKSNEIYDAHGFQAYYQFQGGAPAGELVNPQASDSQSRLQPLSSGIVVVIAALATLLLLSAPPAWTFPL